MPVAGLTVRATPGSTDAIGPLLSFRPVSLAVQNHSNVSLYVRQSQQGPFDKALADFRVPAWNTGTFLVSDVQFGAMFDPAGQSGPVPSQEFASIVATDAFLPTGLAPITFPVTLSQAITVTNADITAQALPFLAWSADVDNPGGRWLKIGTRTIPPFWTGAVVAFGIPVIAATIVTTTAPPAGQVNTGRGNAATITYYDGQKPSQPGSSLITSAGTFQPSAFTISGTIPLAQPTFVLTTANIPSGTYAVEQVDWGAYNNISPAADFGVEARLTCPGAASQPLFETHTSDGGKSIRFPSDFEMASNGSQACTLTIERIGNPGTNLPNTLQGTFTIWLRALTF